MAFYLEYGLNSGAIIAPAPAVLNIIEAWFDKLAILQLQGLRAANKQELERCIMDCIELINETPMAPHWKCTLNDIAV